MIKTKNPKYNFKGTMMDEELIGQYKDEIDLEIAQDMAFDVAPDAMTAPYHYVNLIENTRHEMGHTEKDIKKLKE